MRRKLLASLCLAVLATPGVAAATETIEYGYDVHGRLVKVQRSGTVNAGILTTYDLDDADNRAKKVTTGATDPAPLGSSEPEPEPTISA